MIPRPLLGHDPDFFSGRYLVFREGYPGIGRFPDAPKAEDDDQSAEVSFEACSDSPPYGFPDRDECSHPLAYADLPGPSTFFFRVTERRPTTALLRTVSLEVLPFELSSLPKEDRKVWSNKVRAEAVRRTEPRTKVVSGLLFDDRIIIRSKSLDSGLLSWLSRWFGGGVVVDPVVWSESDRDFGPSYLLSVLDEEIERRRVSEFGDFSVDEVRLSVGSSKIRGQMKKVWMAARSLFSVSPEQDPVVESAVLSLRARNGEARLHVDADGLFRADLPRGRGGGLPRDRFLRLLRDVDEVSAAARKELRAARGRAVSSAR